MTSASAKRARRDPTASRCLARSVVATLGEEPMLEAVTIDRMRQTLSVATLGRADVERLTARLKARFQEAQEADGDHRCSLLVGQGDCSSCATPLSATERLRISIRHDGGTTTIARVTCPTAPKFWRWRDIPFPKVVQRDVEFLEHAEEIDEWKPQLAAAILCGLLALGARSVLPANWAVIGYALAYLAGSWYTAQEVLERLRKRTIDVHFLMLAVAFGSASIGAWGEGATLLFLFSLSGALEHFALGSAQGVMLQRT